jgi:hypothetical protein
VCSIEYFNDRLLQRLTGLSTTAPQVCMEVLAAV